MLASNSVWNLNNNLRRLNEAQEQMSTQSKIQLPSDDPITATRAIKYRNYVATVEQYQSNVDDAISWMEVTENAVSDLNDVIQRLRELTTQAANGTMTDDDKSAIAEEISQLKEQTVQIMNTSYAGRYIFGGYTTDQEPYTMDDDGRVLYQRQYLNMTGPLSSSISETDYEAFCITNADAMYQEGESQSIKYNIGYGNQLAVNVEGMDVIGQTAGSNLFASLDKLLLGLDGETSYNTATIDTSTSTVTFASHEFEIGDILDDLDTDLNRVLATLSDIGARSNYAAMTKNRLSNDQTTYTKLMSNNEDIDIAEASVAVSSAQSVYEASLSVSAKVISKSLVDYLR
jgi:flagellar hook-associated protein 3 FlgL